MLRRKLHHVLLLVLIVVVLLTIYYLHTHMQRHAEVLSSREHLYLGAGDKTSTVDYHNATTLIEPVDATWQSVAGARNKFFVYSAFYERRLEQRRSVRIIGAATRTQKLTESAWCLMHFQDQPLVVSVLAKIKVIREHHNLKYSACFVLCPLGEHQAPPVSVSVVSNLKSPPSNHLLVIDNLGNMSHDVTRGKMAVCVKPVYNYTKTLHLLEFLELYRHLGAEHFTLYRRNVSSDVNCLVENYVSAGAATWLAWELDLKSEVEVWNEGIYSALNDCLYRNMYRYEHVVMVDLDEYLMPRGSENLVQLVQSLDAKHGANVGSYIFQNAFFYQSWPSVNSEDTLSSRLLTLSKTRRKTKLLPPGQRSKYICKPELTVEVGNHFVWEHLKKIKKVNVAANVALSQHYRNVCEYGRKACLKEPSEVDNNALKYSTTLLTRVKHALDFMKNQCDVTSL